MIKVLLVDDDFLARTFLSRLIDWESHDYTLIGTAQDGEDALRMVEEHHPNIIITDISMPVMDGIELIRTLKQQGDKAKIIALSCHDDFEYVKEAMKLGADEYVLKNLLTEQSLLELLEQMKSKLDVTQDSEEVSKTEEEREYYLKLLSGEAEMRDTTVAVTAVMAIRIVNYEEQIGRRDIQQQKRFHSSFVQVCREACGQKKTIRCVHIRQGLYALLIDLSDIMSVSARQQSLQESANVLMQYSERYLAVSLQIGTSRVESFFCQPSECWKQAVCALNERFYVGGSIFYGWQVELYADELPGKAREFCDHIAAYIQQCNTDDIEQAWNEALNAIAQQHTKLETVQKWIEQSDAAAGIQRRQPPEHYSELIGMEQAYLAFRQKTLGETEQYSSSVNMAVKYLQKNHCQPLSLNDAAEYVHLNPAYLSHVFRKETGITFSEYLTSCRIRTAKELLLHSTLKVKEIGQKSGFNDYRNFVKTFKKVTGITPQNYRKQKL